MFYASLVFAGPALLLLAVLRRREHQRRLSRRLPFPPPLHPSNPVARIRASRGQSFHYFHTHVVARTHVDDATAAGKSIEFDVYFQGGAGSPPATIQHPPAFYTSKNKPLPKNMPLEDAVRRFEEETSSDAEAVLILDAKSPAALGVIRK